METPDKFFMLDSKMSGKDFKCFEVFVKEVPKWLEKVDELARAIELWRLAHLDNREDNARSPKTQSMQASSILARNSSGESQGVPDRSPTAAHQWNSISSPRKMVVVHYDAAIQNQIEGLVRNISAGRGYVRKAKISARVSSYANLGSSGVGMQHMRREARSTSSSRGSIMIANNDSSNTLENIESKLSEGQALCEHAAHQLLRDGDCYDDLHGIKDCFESILQTCDIENQKAQEQPYIEDYHRSIDISASMAHAESFAMDIAADDVNNPPRKLGLDRRMDFSTFKMSDRIADLPRLAAH